MGRRLRGRGHKCSQAMSDSWSMDASVQSVSKEPAAFNRREPALVTESSRWRVLAVGVATPQVAPTQVARFVPATAM